MADKKQWSHDLYYCFEKTALNCDYDPSAMSVTSFFSKYTHLREWFAMKLSDVQNNRNQEYLWN